MARSLEQDGSWSLESNREQLTLVGHETSPVQQERRTTATLEAALTFSPASPPERGKPRAASVLAHTSLPSCTSQVPGSPVPLPSRSRGGSARQALSGRHKPSCSEQHCNSCASAGHFCSCTASAVNLIIYFSEPH